MTGDRVLRQLGGASFVQFGSSIHNPEAARDVDVAVVLPTGGNSTEAVRVLKRGFPGDRVCEVTDYGSSAPTRCRSRSRIPIHWVVTTKDSLDESPMGAAIRTGRMINEKDLVALAR